MDQGGPSPIGMTDGTQVEKLSEPQRAGAGAERRRDSQQSMLDKEDIIGEEDGSIDPENEITGIRLVVLFIGLSLCTLLVGLVSRGAHQTIEHLGFLI